MFRVIVLGGVALVDCGARTDLGRATTVDASDEHVADAGAQDSGFSFPPVDASPQFDGNEGDVIVFPGEANAPLPDAGKP